MVKFSDGAVRQAEPPATLLMRQIHKLAYWDDKAKVHHEAMRQAAQAAQEHRREIAAILKAAGIFRCWSDGTLYELNSLCELATFDCPEACDVMAKPEPTDEQIDEAAYVQALVDTFQPDRIDEEVT